MKRLDLGMIVRYDGRLAEVFAIGEGRTIHLRFLGSAPCPTCGQHRDVGLLEHAPLLQDKVEAVPTIAIHPANGLQCASRPSVTPPT